MGRKEKGSAGWLPLGCRKRGFKSGDKGAFGVWDTPWGSGSNLAVTT